MSKDYLEIPTYDDAERNARTLLSNRMIQAFAPVTFETSNYPCRVHAEAELLRYVECIKDGKSVKWFRKDYSQAEADLICRTAEAAVSICSERFDSIVRPSTSPLAATRLLRIAERVSQRLGRKLTIFEIGPGCGYFGAMAAQHGHRWIGTDNSQAFYLWQNRLHRTLFGFDFTELAGKKYPPPDMGTASTHLPWWHFCRLFSLGAPKADLVISNAVLGEVSDLALKYIVRIASEIVADSPARLFAFDLWGAEFVASREQIRKAFADTGWRETYGQTFIGFIHGPDAQVLEGLDHELPPCGGEPLLKGEAVATYTGQEVPRDYPFMSYLGYETPQPTKNA